MRAWSPAASRLRTFSALRGGAATATCGTQAPMRIKSWREGEKNGGIAGERSRNRLVQVNLGSRAASGKRRAQVFDRADLIAAQTIPAIPNKVRPAKISITVLADPI